MSNFTNQGLIKAVKDRPAIWNRKDPHRKNYRFVHKMWLEIRNLFPHYSVDTLKKKFKNLKDQYRKEMKKYLEARQNDPESAKKSMWLHFKRMSFLQEEMHGYTKAYLSQDDEMPKLIESDNFSSDDDSLQNQDDLKVKSEAATTTRSTPAAKLPLSSLQKRNSSSAGFELLNARNKRTILQNDTFEHKNSDDYHYLLSLLPTMEKFDVIQKLRVRNKINEIIINELQNSSTMS